MDYGQNLELPAFKHEQPGPSYYYSHMSVYNLGMVSHAHIVIVNGVGPKEHMHAHVYHEGVAKKGANNVVSLIMKTLNIAGLLSTNNPIGELNIIFNNFSSQTKNNFFL